VAGEVEFQPTEADYVRANRDWYVGYLKGPGGRRSVLRYTVGAGIGGGIVGATVGGWIAAVSYAVATAFIGLILAPLVFGLCYLTLPRLARRLYRQDKSLQRPLRMAWSDAGITFSSQNGWGKVEWADLYRWTPARGTFLFFISERLFHFLPRRVLAEEQTADLVATAAAHGPPRI
jgi:hypothetical protein